MRQRGGRTRQRRRRPSRLFVEIEVTDNGYVVEVEDTANKEPVCFRIEPSLGALLVTLVEVLAAPGTPGAAALQVDEQVAELLKKALAEREGGDDG